MPAWKADDDDEMNNENEKGQYNFLFYTWCKKKNKENRELL